MDKFSTQSISEIREEAQKNGWPGLAWSCLRRSEPYKSAWTALKAGTLSRTRFCRQFGLRNPKNWNEAFGDGKPPEFQPVRIVVPKSSTTAQVKRTRLLLRSDQVAIVITRNSDIRRQLRVAEASLKESSDRARGALKVRSLDEIADLAAPALFAYQLSEGEGWGPTKIGKLMFPKMAVLAAKTKARDLVSRGRSYAESSYLTFALQTEVASARNTSSSSKPLSTDSVETNRIMTFRIVSP